MKQNERDQLEHALDRLSRWIVVGVAVLAIALVSVHAARQSERRASAVTTASAR